MKIELDIGDSNIMATIGDLTTSYDVQRIRLVADTVVGLQILDCISFLEVHNQKNIKKVTVELEL